ncbi:MAG: thioredoxin family protein [Candidatus Gastranaerophilaceae bacterium]
MNKKSLFTSLAILILPIIAFFGLTFDKSSSTVAYASGKPQIIKFSSNMCIECKEVERIFKKLLPKYSKKFEYTEIIVDNNNDMNNKMIKKYRVTLVPTIIMLNSDGSPYIRIEGSIPEDEMEEYIKGLK